MKQGGLGAIPSPFDIRDYTLVYQASNIQQLPQSFDLGILKIKNQGQKPTCVAHSLAELIEFHNWKETKVYNEFSTEFIYGCREQGDYIGNGMNLRDGLKNITKYGDVLKQILPGNNNYDLAMKIVQSNFSHFQKLAYPNRISSYYKIRKIDELKYALYNHGPVVAGMKWFDNAFLSLKRIYKYNKNNSYGGHAVLITGWTKKYWIVQNSWGERWGKKGRFYIPIDKTGEVFFEAYGVTDDIKAIKKVNNKIKTVSPIINSIVNITKRVINFYEQKL